MSICLNITARTYLHTRARVQIYIYTYIYGFRLPRASLAPPPPLPPPSSLSSSSYVTRRSFHVSPAPMNSPPFRFVGKRNRTCPSAHVRMSGCVSRVSTFDGTKDEAAAEGTRPPGGGSRGKRGGKGGSHVCGRSTTIYSRIPAEASATLVPPAPSATLPPPCDRSVRSPRSSSSLILFLFLLYYDGLLHFHSDAGLKIKSLIHDA